MKDLEDIIARELPHNTLVIFHAEDNELKEVVQGLAALQKTFDRYGITAIACPKSIYVTVVPSGTTPSEVKAFKREGTLN